MKKPNIGILTIPITEAGNVPLSNLIGILEPLSNNLHLITGNDGYRFFKDDKRVHTYGIELKSGKNTITRVLKYIYTQLQISYMIVKISRNVDMWFLFLGECLAIPQLIMKILRKKNVFIPSGSPVRMTKAQKGPFLKVIAILSKINCEFADKIILYSSNLIKEWNLEKYKDKISIAHEHFLDFDKFKIKKKFDERENLVGCIGRLSGEKGVFNFAKAIPAIFKERDNLEFLIGGDGPLQGEIKRYLNEKNLNSKVKLPGWIPHDELPEYLNELKLLVLPSYTEGLPNIMLEAMVCGSPVLATPVGAILDVIKEGENGFIMESNNPECIAENVIRALNHPNLDETVRNARNLIEKKYTYEAAVERYRKILNNL